MSLLKTQSPNIWAQAQMCARAHTHTHTHEAMRDGPPVPRVQLLSGVLAGPTEDKQ